MTWQQWITSEWAELAEGQKLEAPQWLPHPRFVGFSPIDIATPEGQCSDWGLSVMDGSRIHVHEFPGGRFVVHRDRHDPAAGVGHAIAHVLTETFVGPVLFAVGLLALANSAARA